MPRQHNINGTKVPFTAEEEATRDVEEQEWNDGALDRALKNLRVKRNRLLAETDWTANYVICYDYLQTSIKRFTSW